MEFWDLGFSAEEEKEFYVDAIGNKKAVSRYMTQAQRESKPAKCYYCGRETTEICNSHYVPAFCLRNISNNGDVYNLNSLIGTPILDKENGVKEAGVFRIICRPCDNTIFSGYENPDNYGQPPTQKMLAQIALKNYLRYISKRRFEISLYNGAAKISDFGKFVSDSMSDVNNLDLGDFRSGYETAKRLSRKPTNDYYYMFFYKTLNYVVPIASQSLIVLISDFEGNIVNNIYNTSPDNHIKSIHICVFPLKNNSVIVMFGENSNKIYRKFYKQFNSLDASMQLPVLNYMIFLYTEDVFLSKLLPNEIITNSNLINVARQTTRAFYRYPSFNPILSAAERFDLNRWNCIPNLLDERYKLR